MSVVIETSLGDITIDLYVDERPNCCKNFLKLCKIKYYNFCLFHSVQRNFIAQTGDPTGTSKGGESVYGTLYGEQARYFDWEFVPKIKHARPGLVSMVNNGNNMHGSQFFITLGSSLDYLDGVHTVFGEVTEGLEVITKLNEAYCDEQFKPYRDIRIHHTIILEDPYDDPPGLEMPDRSPSPTPEVIERARLAADAELDEMAGMTDEQIREIMEEREEKANAQILEMIGDLPSTDITAPENVLFVCKLNSVTTDEDLEIIFSRFGAIKSCEVIRDNKSGESLQYAFIEFEKKEYCESAYFKMDNVLIDDRRIHVDFSQSVSKFKWKGKGKGVETFQDEPKKPKYIIKDKSKRQDNNYDLVFDEDEDKTSKKKHKDRSHDPGDNNKKKENYRRRSRSPLDIRRKDRSPDRERRNDRRREDRRDRNSPPRHRGDRNSPRRRDRYSPVQRHRGQSPPQRHRDNRHMSPPRYRDERRHRENERHYSPPKHRGRKSSSPKSRDRQGKMSPVRSKERREERHHRDDSEDKEEYNKRKKDKKNRYDDIDNESLERKKKKNIESSDEEESKKRKKKKKRKDDSSDENENIDRKKKKKKKKKAESSSEEDEHVKHKQKKRKRSFSNERQKNRDKSESESPPHRKSDKYSDKYKEEKHRNNDNKKEKQRKQDRDENRIRR